MAEIKNSFLRSKMNKDLDDRLIPNGEYRDARNISVGKSEDDDIGALENVRGNTLVPGSNIGDLEVIGYLTDNNSETIYLFLTNNSTASPGTTHYIYKYFNSSYTKILEGEFLNFSADNYITGVNLVENLLFWTDNRNQPRKINVNKPFGYYFKENQISVAKYNPYEPIELLKTVTATNATSTGTTLTLATVNPLITKGMNLIVKDNSNVQQVDADKYIYVTNVVGTTITLNAQPTDFSNNNYDILSTDTITFLVTTMTGKDITFDFNNGNDWPGDPDFLQDLFVRFSYRFKFDDQEYSIMAPFSQPTFIPQQKGYFLEGDEDASYRSTILDFMQNGVQNVELIIPLPDVQAKLGDGTLDTYKIIELDILYKESDARSVKVLDSINVDDLNSASNTYVYNYQSRKPYKTLPERQTVRVYDRVPVKAFSQEVSGNRVMYGNFQSQHTPPATLDYNVGASAKNTTVFTNWAEYPNHTLKQNRNYQVGFILSDKFGRQSSVILSSVDLSGQTVGGSFLGGSTFYHPYTSANQNLKEWFGDALKVVINGEISSSVARDGEGAPGLYADQIGNGFNTTANSVGITSPFIYTFTLGSNAVDVPVLNSYLRGEFTDFVKVTNVDDTAAPVYTITTDGQVNNFLYSDNALNTPDTKYSYTITNTLGWYSYKVVVKQQEQDYYNCYLPGFLNGYPDHGGTSPYPTNENNKTAHVILLNDNINKIPRDLNETSDQQKQFRSSVRLYGRVNNTATDNVQYFPVSTSGTQTLPLNMTADTIATAVDLNMGFTELSNAGRDNFYQLDTNPLISRLASSNAGTTNVGVLTANLTTPFLSIVETEPVESLLQLFYETTTAGLIADLNADINTGFDGVAGLSALGYSQFENMAANTDITGVFRPQNNQGSDFLNTQIASVAMTVTDGNGLTRATGNLADGFTGDFKLITSGTGYKIQTAVDTFVFSNAGFDSNKNSKEVYNYNFTWTTVPGSGGDTSSTPFTGSLTNNEPIFTDWVSGSSLPSVIVEAGNTTAVVRGADNGSATNNTTQIQYSIVSQSPGSYFSIPSATSGTVVKSSLTPIGVYTLNLKAEDAVVSGVVQNGSLSVTKQQVITVGAVPINSSSRSGCEANVAVSQGIPNSFGAIVPDTTNSGNTRTAIWYIANGTFTSGGTGGYNTSNLPIQPSANTSDSNFLFRLGTLNSAALTQGTIVFQCNMQQEYTNASSAPRSGSIVNWFVYHRADSSSSWNQINDVNNSSTANYPANAELINNSQNTTKYASTAFAFNTPGEYAVVATGAYNTYAGTYNDSLALWVNSNDLYYSTCVVEDGSQVTPPFSNPTAWTYNISSNQSAYGCYATSTVRYAPMPYVEYVDLLYLNNNLSSPANGGTYNYPNFFGLDTAFGQPFDQVKVSAKFNVGGIKISGDAATCSDKQARACISSATTCSKPVPGALNWL